MAAAPLETYMERPNYMASVEMVPVCPYCGERIFGEFVLFGSEPMHKECYQQFGRESAETEEDEELVPQFTS